MLSGVAAAAAISVSLARQRPVVPPTINERRVRCDGVMSTVLFPGVNPQADYLGGGLSTKDKAPAIGHILAFHSIRALTRCRRCSRRLLATGSAAGAAAADRRHDLQPADPGTAGAR